jgi:histidyl-tRNA synthetase
MKEIKQDTYKGTRILLGNRKRELLNKCVALLIEEGFQEIMIPIIQNQEVFSGKVGEENNNLMFNFKDRGNRDLVLAPEYTAVIQRLAKNTFKYEKDLKLFYIQECFRGEKPQAGRYRQFTQLGVEIINPTKDYTSYLIEISNLLINKFEVAGQEVNTNVTRGLDYYENGKGFEITLESLGSSKQICGGGSYDRGIGFAIGVDRLI